MRFDEKDKIAIEENTAHEYIFSYDRYDKLLSSNRVIGIDIDKKKNSTRYLRVRCSYCKTEYDVQHRSLIKKRQKCPHCCNVYENSFAHYIEVELGLNINDVWDFELNKVNPYHIYRNFNKHAIWLKCKKHGSYEKRTINLNEKSNCPYCSGRKFHTDESFGDWLLREHCNQSIDEFWDYKKNTADPFKIYKRDTETKVWIKCKKCEYHNSYLTTPCSFYKGHRCTFCHPCGKNIDIHLYDSFGYNYFDRVCMNWSKRNEVSPFKITCKTGRKYWFICDICNKEFEKEISNMTMRDEWCPYCNMSKGEKRIETWLKHNNVNYVYDSEYFKDLLSPKGNPLRPDFILPDYKIWIEYDGEFHYKNKMDEDCYKTLLIHDEIKNNYAKENDWKLIRIPYWDFDNIEEILDEVLKDGK